MLIRLSEKHSPASIILLIIKGGGGGGGSGLQFDNLKKKDFELGVGGEGQDTSRHFEGGFGSMRAIQPL